MPSSASWPAPPSPTHPDLPALRRSGRRRHRTHAQSRRTLLLVRRPPTRRPWVETEVRWVKGGGGSADTQGLLWGQSRRFRDVRRMSDLHTQHQHLRSRSALGPVRLWGSSRRRSTECAMLSELVRKVADTSKVAAGNRTSSLEWSGEDPEGWRSVSFQRGRTMLSSVGAKRRKSWLLAASALASSSLGISGPALAQCSAVDASGNATCSSGTYTNPYPAPASTTTSPRPARH